MLNLSEEDKNLIKSTDLPAIINLSCGSYLVKRSFDKIGYSELISKKIADFMGINTPNYYPVTIGKNDYTLSEDLNQLGTFVTALNFTPKEDPYSYSIRWLYNDSLTSYKEVSDKSLYENSLSDIWDFFERNYSSKVTEKLMLQIIKIYFFDILFLNWDRNPKNWGILTKPNREVEIIMFDNEYIFTDGYNTIDLYADFTNGNCVNVYQDLKVFLRESDSKFTEMLQMYLNLITPHFFARTIALVEQEFNIVIPNKKDLIKKYNKNAEKLMEIYNEIIRKEPPHAR